MGKVAHGHLGAEQNVDQSPCLKMNSLIPGVNIRGNLSGLPNSGFQLLKPPGKITHISSGDRLPSKPRGENNNCKTCPFQQKDAGVCSGLPV